MNVKGKARIELTRRKINLYQRMISDPTIRDEAKIKAEIALSKLEMELKAK